MAGEGVEFKLGQLDAAVTSLKGDVTDIKADMKDQNAKLDKLVSHMERQRGSVATLSAVGAIAGAVGGAILEWFRK